MSEIHAPVTWSLRKTLSRMPVPLAGADCPVHRVRLVGYMCPACSARRAILTYLWRRAQKEAANVPAP